VFGDRVIATAILDRLLHHAVTLNIRGNSYRLPYDEATYLNALQRRGSPLLKNT